MVRFFGTTALAAAFAFAGPLLGWSAPAHAKSPWAARKPPAPPTPAHQLRDVNRWPVEPESPATVDPTRFRVSVDHMCAHSIPAEAALAAVPVEEALGPRVLAAATEAGVDPFMLAGLVFTQSDCKAKLDAKEGYGLLHIQPAMYESEGAPSPPGDKEAWTKRALLDPASNLRLGAQLLKMWQDAHLENDEDFKGVPHRGGVAHFVWGDIVRSSGNEDQTYTARRRLIGFYQQTPDTPVETSFGVTIVSPLEGWPRVASSGPGEDRAGGKRRHRGIDLAAAIGEPVHAIADGKVIFAGANMPNAPRRTIPSSEINRYRWRRFGAGGIYICIEHDPDKKVVSCYMHLDTYTINEGDTVKSGQEIGRVGRTGVQVSPPHLHFEIRVGDRIVDPSRPLASLCIPPRATQSHRYAVQAQRTRIARTRMVQAAAQKL